jgi:hypothetical protein
VEPVVTASQDIPEATGQPAEPVEAPSVHLPTPAPAWLRKRPLIAAGIVVVAAAGIAIGVTATSGPGTVQIHGALALGPLAAIDTTTGIPADGDACQAEGGYDDITAGAAVVGNGTGQTIGTGALQAGTEANVDDSAGTPLGNCTFHFAATVPAGESTYTVTISHRGMQTLTPQQVTNGILLTLGDD